jgi:phospholipid/cholesterol/gamma-HCH transport system ATP-binding protein
VKPPVPAIELIDIHTALSGAPVLNGVSFAAERDRITVLLGPSGVGKTTCLRQIVGLLTPDRGDILVEGRSTVTMRKAARLELSKRFGVLLQGTGVFGSALWESMTVEDNLVLQLGTLVKLPEPELKRRAFECLHEVGLASDAERFPSELSAGMRRRVALARALVAEPEFAILDSLELGVDVVRLRGLCDLIFRRHQQYGGTYVIATQSMDLARRLADDIVVLWDGVVIEAGPADEVLASLRPEVVQLISGSTAGPLGMAPEREHDHMWTPEREHDHMWTPEREHDHMWTPERMRAIPASPAEQGLDIPIPLAALALLMVISASALWLGGGNKAELLIVAAVWAAATILLVLRRRRER